VDSTNFECKRCKSKSYTVVDLGMMYGDEDWVYLIKCNDCGFSERVGEYC